MKTQEFYAQLNEVRVMETIAEAEAHTSGEIRVFISEKAVQDPVAEAWRQFGLLGMNHTAQRNGLLIFIAPVSQRYAIIGDEAAAQRAPEGFWLNLAEVMGEKLRTVGPTEALCHVITRCGVFLTREFPQAPEDTNELPDMIVRG